MAVITTRFRRLTIIIDIMSFLRRRRNLRVARRATSGNVEYTTPALKMRKQSRVFTTSIFRHTEYCFYLITRHIHFQTFFADDESPDSKHIV